MPDLAKCRRCGKIFGAQTGKVLCAKCTSDYLYEGERVLEAIEKHSLRTPREIAEFTGIPIDRVEDLIGSSALIGHAVEQNKPCLYCGERPAQKRSEYCLQCRMMLNKELGSAARLIGSLLEREKRKPRVRIENAGPTLDQLLKSKRERTGTKRMDPTPRNRYSG
ncbi:MAG: hypothetical protein AMXMBFR4_13100 [Candidatus Hydrogenedentota bacterium]